MPRRKLPAVTLIDRLAKRILPMLLPKIRIRPVPELIVEAYCQGAADMAVVAARQAAIGPGEPSVPSTTQEQEEKPSHG